MPILASAFIFILSGCGKECIKKTETIDNDKDYYRLKGNVQYFSEISKYQNRIEGVACTFNEQGNILTKWILNEKNYTEFIPDKIYEYNQNGRLIKITENNQLTEFQYDKSGNQITKLRYAYNQLVERESKTYNGRNLLIKEEMVLTLKNIQSLGHREHTYNECDNLIMTKFMSSELEYKNISWMSNRIEKYEYDNHGNRNKITTINDPSTEITTEKFDENDKNIWFKRTQDDKVIAEGHYKYDKLGREVEFTGTVHNIRINYDNDKNDRTINYFENDPNKPYGTEKYVYTYDNLGNWTKEIKITNGQEEYTKARTIKYF